jgi:hypothetical protein
MRRNSAPFFHGAHSPRNTKPASKGGPVSGQAGEVLKTDNSDTPRKSEFLQEPFSFLATAELWPHLSTPSGGLPATRTEEL